MVLLVLLTLYNTALEQRKIWWQRGQGKGTTYYQQATELPDFKATFPDYAEVNAQVLQDVLRRLEKTFQAFFRRVQAGETPGYPRFHGRGRYNSFTYPQMGEHGGATLDGGVLSLSKIGRIPIRLHRPIEGTPKTVTISREADGWYACILLRGRASASPAAYWAGDGDRPGDRGVRYVLRRHTHLQPRLVSQSRAGAEIGATACLTPQEEE